MTGVLPRRHLTTEVSAENACLQELFRSLHNNLDSKFGQQMKCFDNLETNYTSLSTSIASLNATLDRLRCNLTDQKEDINQLKREN